MVMMAQSGSCPGTSGAQGTWSMMAEVGCRRDSWGVTLGDASQGMGKEEIGLGNELKKGLGRLGKLGRSGDWEEDEVDRPEEKDSVQV